jgi:transposase-like protein
VQQLRTTVSERQNLTAEVLEQQTQLTEIARREQESRSQLQLRQQQRAAVLAQLGEASARPENRDHPLAT